MSDMQPSYLFWCVGLVIAVPIIIVFLNECIDRSRRGTGYYSDVLILLRDAVLPLLVLVILVRFVFSVSGDNLSAKFLSSAFWLVLMYSVFRITRRIIGTGSYSAADWRSMVPHMFLRLPPYAIMGYIVFHIVQNLWSFPVKEMATTLGIGSIVIAFALQDTLSNLVSGVLLVANSPFKTGDWVHVGSVEGKISAVNWRYTHIENWNGDLVVIPNGSIAGDSIENHSRPGKETVTTQRFKLSFEHPPNKVKRLFEEVFTNTPGILQSPEPCVAVVNIDDPEMEYEAEYWTEDYGSKPDVHAEFMSRMWYAIQRHGLSLPTSTYNIHSFDGSTVSLRKQEALLEYKDCLDWLPHFLLLPQNIRQEISNNAVHKHFAKDEVLINQHETEQAICVVVAGTIKLQDDHDSDFLHAGDLFGESGLFGRAISPVTATAVDDVDVLFVSHDLINEVINRHSGFAKSISTVIDQRRSSREQTSDDSAASASNTSLPSLAELQES